MGNDKHHHRSSEQPHVFREVVYVLSTGARICIGPESVVQSAWPPKARDQPCPQAKNVLLLRLPDLCVLPSGTGLVGAHSARVSLNRRDLFFSLSGLGEHALARITSVEVSWTWVWLLRCSHGVEGQKKPCDRKRQRCPFAELVVAGSLLNFDFLSAFLLQLSTRQPKSVSPAQTPIFTLFIVAGLPWHRNSILSRFCGEPLPFSLVDWIKH